MDRGGFRSRDRYPRYPIGMKKKRPLSSKAVDRQRKELGAELKRRRQAKKLTQEAAAAMAGTTRKEIATIELGRSDYQMDPFIRYCDPEFTDPSAWFRCGDPGKS